MVELEGNESENSNVSQNLKGDFTSFQQKVKQRNPCELQPSNTLGRSKRGAPQLIPENEVGHSPTRVSTGSQLIENIKIRWGLDMRLRGVYINCELMRVREAQFYSQLHGEPQWELSSQVSLSAKRDLTRQLKSTRWSRRCNETKMTIVEMPCNTNWFGTPYLIVSRSLSTEIHVLGMAKKKKSPCEGSQKCIFMSFSWLSKWGPTSCKWSFGGTVWWYWGF